MKKELLEAAHTKTAWALSWERRREEILEKTGLGLWMIHIDKKSGLRELYADDVMRKNIAIGKDASPAECYKHWYDRINDGYYHYINLSIESMIQSGKETHLEYTWNHPLHGEVIVRCIGIRVENCEDRICLEGYHRIISELEKPTFLPEETISEMFEYNERKQSIYFHTKRKLLAGEAMKEKDFPECWIQQNMVHPHFVKAFRAMFFQVEKNKENRGSELLLKNKEGVYAWFKIRTCRLGREAQDVNTIVVFLDPANQERAIELEYIRKNDFYEAMLSETAAYAEVNVESGILQSSGGLWASYARESRVKKGSFEETIEKHIKEVVLPEEWKNYRRYLSVPYMKEMYREGRRTEKYCFQRFINGELYWMELVLHVFKEKYSENMYALVYLKNIDAEKKKELEQQKAAQRDPLTNVYNRKSFEQEVIRFMREEEEAGGAIMVLDLDNFKHINDSYGHLKGDEVLKELTEILKYTFRKRDLIGRMGGDEFLVFIKNVTDKKIMDRRMAQLLEALKYIGGYPFTCSAGICFVRKQDFSYEEALKRADEALYNSKKNGKNQYSYYTEK